MNNYLLRIQYVGSHFYGFQKQNGIPTVQGAIEEALLRTLRVSVSTIGAARTDKGVNAINQYMNFYLQDEIDVEILRERLNSLLFFQKIFVKEGRPVDLSFHSRKSAKGKIYAYILSDNPQATMFISPYVYIYHGGIDFGLVEKAFGGLKGKHDFTFFSNRDRSRPDRNNFCEIFDAGFLNKDAITIFYFYADRFLYHMVRRMVYYVLKSAQGKVPEKVLANPFGASEIPYARQVLPGEPLFLVDVVY